MHKITLIGTAHNESRLCNAEELLKILRVFDPEVVFEEFRPGRFNSLYERGNLEAHAIKKFREFKSFQEVPVDTFDMPENLDVEMGRVYDCVKRASQEYRELKQVLFEEEYRYGFEYLNSAICEKLIAKLCEIEDKTIIETGDKDLIRVLEKWRQVIQSLELEMVRNIYEYCGRNAFNTGVLLVGAAHKRGIVKEIQKFSVTEADLINWTFAFSQNA